MRDDELTKDVDVWLDRDRIATRRRIPGTGTLVHEAYERFMWGDGNKAASHSTVATLGGTFYGTIQSARFSRGVVGLPGTLRTAVIENFRADLEACAYTALMEAFPYLRSIGKRHAGRMIVQLENRS